MILLSIANGLIPEFPSLYAGLAAWLAGLILLLAIKRQARLQFLVMFSVGAAALSWAAASGRPTAWGPILTSNQSLLAMLAAVSFLRWHARFALFVLAVDLATLFAYAQYASD